MWGFIVQGAKMKKYITLTLTILYTCLIWMGCSDSTSSDEDVNTSWVFVSNEGTFGDSNGSISMINDFGAVTTEYIKTNQNGESNGVNVVQSIKVYKDKLIAIVNYESLIKIYNINENGISLPGIEISTNGSSPREMVIINDLVYFTNWESDDIKIFNLFNYNIEETSIHVGKDPEGIIFDDSYLWVANSGDSTISKIDLSTHYVETFVVGTGPQNLTIHNNQVIISRTSYDNDWNTLHAITKMKTDGTELYNNNYGLGAPCGGSIISHNNILYRSENWTNSGAESIIPLDNDLNYIYDNRIGYYINPLMIYHIENINNHIYFCLTEDNNPSVSLLKILDSNNQEIASYNVGYFPGDIAYWKKSD